MRRAMEHGADRVREWTDEVTHIIADKSLTYQDVLKHLQITSLPVGSPSLQLWVLLANQLGKCDCGQ